ncbi:MAG: hypothetical protein AAFS06_06370 [Cyanobacteria bacterium J06631_12]
MYKVSLRDAKNRLAQLMEVAAKGESVIIVREDGTAFSLTLAEAAADSPDTPTTTEAPQPTTQPSPQKRGVSQSSDFDAQSFMQELEDAYEEQTNQQASHKQSADWDTSIEKYFSED